MDLGPHATFIIASYAATAFILAMLIGWIVAENRALKRRLADLESRGIKRRSDERKAAPRKSEAHSLA
ncbi:MAG: heme exporter protein CcmD [Pseudorhodoplanes sp.]|uniref:heme exporter protein CcmD n=1 Tax=Pseudorhodoplanes sp. TaxID=1934341 RepID=UPI003D0CEB47